MRVKNSITGLQLVVQFVSFCWPVLYCFTLVIKIDNILLIVNILGPLLKTSFMDCDRGH